MKKSKIAGEKLEEFVTKIKNDHENVEIDVI